MEEIRKFDAFDMEEFCRLLIEGSEKTIAILENDGGCRRQNRTGIG